MSCCTTLLKPQKTDIKTLKIRVIVSGETNFSKSHVSPNIRRKYFSKFYVSSNIGRNYFSKSYASPNIRRNFSETSETYFENGFADHLAETSFTWNTTRYGMPSWTKRSMRYISFVWQNVSPSLTKLTSGLTKCQQHCRCRSAKRLHRCRCKISTVVTKCQHRCDKMSAPLWQNVNTVVDKMSAPLWQNVNTVVDVDQHHCDKMLTPL